METAIERGELPDKANPAQIAFELNALAMGANQALQLHGDRVGLERARRSMTRVIEISWPCARRAVGLGRIPFAPHEIGCRGDAGHADRRLAPAPLDQT